MTWLFEILFPRYVWRVKTSDKKIYLTFDDGPIPEVTEWVLEQLRLYNAKSTFFVVGDNVRKYPEIFQKILTDGHCVGNHTQNHIKGWKNETDTYLANFQECEKSISELKPSGTNLFRPPYGQIKRSQANEILKMHKILMWSVLTKDYEANLSERKCLNRAIRQTREGSIVLFHDSLKAQKNLYYVLPRFLEHFSKKGYEFCTIEC
ncbi:polysaccharide deacetylase family protein [Lacihabitans soyangensis]|uniref:Polysaccharide deacetylase family protein n=2 Tax=Lacihabitans soyangensis TaxID=869394 RepID=A0AAE3H257_9BACT|nr:polysaccharide deacetylase family protein [Lacihabitans soyangensis]